MNEKEQVLRYLLSVIDLDPFIKNNDGHTAYDLAVKEGSIQMKKMLLKYQTKFKNTAKAAQEIMKNRKKEKKKNKKKRKKEL